MCGGSLLRIFGTGIPYRQDIVAKGDRTGFQARGLIGREHGEGDGILAKLGSHDGRE